MSARTFRIRAISLDLDKEIERIMNSLREQYNMKLTRIDVSKIIAEKSRKLKLNLSEIKKILFLKYVLLE